MNVKCIIIILILVYLIWLIANVVPRFILYPFRLSKNRKQPKDKYLEFKIEGKVLVRYFNNPGNMYTVLFCHGAYTNITYCNTITGNLNHLGYDVITFDYRYNNIPSLYEDGDIVYRYLQKRLKSDKIIIWGECLGAAIAVDLASRYHCHRLIMVAPWSDMVGATRGFSLLPMLLCYIGEISFRLNDLMDNIKRIKSVNVPIVLVHSRGDRNLSYNNSLKLYDAITHQEKRLITFEDKTHPPRLKFEDVQNILKE